MIKKKNHVWQFFEFSERGCDEINNFCQLTDFFNWDNAVTIFFLTNKGIELKLYNP